MVTRTTPTDWQADIAIDLYETDGWNKFLFDANGVDVYICWGKNHISKVIQTEQEFLERL